MRHSKVLNVLIFFCALFVKRIPSNPITINGEKEVDCELTASGVYVSLSSQAEIFDDNNVLRWIQVHWWGITNQNENDFVGIWVHDPTIDPDGMIESFLAVGVDGGITSSLRFNGSDYPDEVPSGSLCLPYWGGYVQNGIIIHSSCLRLRPRWMSDIREALEGYGISEVLLPGSHDAGAYGSINGMFITESVAKWTITQDETFWQQLVLGVRCFDVRVAYYDNTTEKFFVNHGDVRIRPLIPYLEDVSKFLNETDEIVIFDIHGFYHGFDKYENAKANLTTLLEFYFKDWMVPQNLAPNPLLGNLWSLGKRIVVTYPESETYSDYIWNVTVHHLWGDNNDLNDLYEYMDTNIPEESGRGSLWSAMTEFTPNAMDVAVNRWKGLRGAANITNEPVTLWLRREWWTMVNIISMDFTASSDVINVVIEGNVKKYQCNIIPKKPN